MSDPREATLQAMLASLEAALPARVLQRGLPVDPAAEKADRLEAGLVCIVSRGGGAFANWSGREGELGDMDVKLVCLCAVGENAPRLAIEQLELAILADLIGWCQAIKPEPLDDVVPGSWAQSSQMEHPFGWVVLELKVRNV